jgi:ABC-2 type transport system ATP-binding protein
MSPIVSIDRVVKRYGAVTATAGLSFDVRPGEMFGLIGPDGAGKTTTLRVLLGLLAPHGGTVRTCGLDPLKESARLSEKIGYLSQRFTLYGDLSIDENIAFFAEIHGVRDYRARRDRLLDMTQLTPFRGRLAEQLSGGMKQKLALACTLVHEPELILLDEPTTGVDPVSRREFWKLLSEFRAAGVTVVLATPYLDEAERCSRVALLHEGRLLALDEPGRLRAASGGTLLEILAPDPRSAVAALRGEGVEHVQLFGDRIHVWLPDTDASTAEERIRAAAARARLEPSGVRPVMPSLEDVFIQKLGGIGVP